MITISVLPDSFKLQADHCWLGEPLVFALEHPAWGKIHTLLSTYDPEAYKKAHSAAGKNASDTLHIFHTATLTLYTALINIIDDELAKTKEPKILDSKRLSRRAKQMLARHPKSLKWAFPDDNED